MENESVGKNNGVATIPFAAYQAAEVRWHKRLIAMAFLIGFIVAEALMTTECPTTTADLTDAAATVWEDSSPAPAI